MSKCAFIICCLLVVLLVAAFVALRRTAPADTTVMTQAENDDYTVIVKRWQDRSPGPHKRYDNRFRTELLYLGRFPISSYEFAGRVQITNAVITWTKLEEFSVTFDKTVTIRCTWDDRRALWERTTPNDQRIEMTGAR
jgi:hypothetical protein